MPPGRPKDDTATYGPPSRPLADDEFYGPAREVALASIPRSHEPYRTDRVRRSTWTALFADVALRLEQTSPSHALEIPIRDEHLLRSARSALLRYFGAWGRGYVRLFTRRDPPRLYIARGKNWYKPGGMDLPAEEKEEEGA